jgi:hypothetical protein
MRMDKQMEEWTEGQADGRTDGQTDITALIVASCKFSNAPKSRRDCTAPKIFQGGGWGGAEKKNII